MSGRTSDHVCRLSGHEMLLVALYRALSDARQREICGLAYRGASVDSATVLRFRDAAATLGAERLEASTLRPFIDAARGVA